MMDSLRWTLLIVLLLITQVLGGGNMYIRFLKYSNPGGKDNGGSCCDGTGFFCERNGCDHYFIVCLDDFSRDGEDGTNPGDCHIRYIKTGVTENHDNPPFGTKIGDTDNPLKLNFTTPSTVPEKSALRVRVMDKDKNSDDFVDLVKTVIMAPSPDYVARSRPFNVTLKSRTSLYVEVTITCLEHYYGVDCGKRCLPPSSGQHYTCDTQTGDKLCHAGWSGPECDSQAELCESDWCQNGGTCSLMQGERVCSCPGMLTGRRCETHACDQRCAGGTCYWWGSGSHDYICACYSGYRAQDSINGQTCERV